MFEVSDQIATLSSVNPRSEKHGEDAVPAADLGIQFDASNKLLSHFGSRLLDSLYWRDRKSVVQQELAAVEPVSDKPDLKNPCIDGSLKLKYAGVGYNLRVDYGVGPGILIEGVDVNAVKITPLEGGTVSYHVRVQFKNPEPAQIGLLATMVGAEITVSLTPPAAEQDRLAA